MCDDYRAEDRLAEARRELEAVRGSVSFRVGRSVTALPRALRGHDDGAP